MHEVIDMALLGVTQRRVCREKLSVWKIVWRTGPTMRRMPEFMTVAAGSGQSQIHPIQKFKPTHYPARR